MAELHFSLEKVYWKEEVPVDVTPTREPKTVTPEAGQAFNKVNVGAIPPEYVVPTGTVNITQNGTVPVAGKATAEVNIPQGVFPSGTKLITENVTGEDVTNYAAVDVAVPVPSGTKQINVTQNGTTTEDVTDYADAEITVNTLPAKGIILDAFDSDGYPTEASLNGFSSFPSSSLARITKFIFNEGVTSIGSNAVTIASLRELVLPQSLNTIANFAFRYSGVVNLIIPPLVSVIGVDINSSNGHLESVIFQGNITNIARFAFENSGANTGVVFDFRNCTAVPVLENSNAFKASVPKTFIVPQSLLTTWQNETNWVGIQNTTWEGV